MSAEKDAAYWESYRRYLRIQAQLGNGVPSWLRAFAEGTEPEPPDYYAEAQR